MLLGNGLLRARGELGGRRVGRLHIVRKGWWEGEGTEWLF